MPVQTDKASGQRPQNVHWLSRCAIVRGSDTTLEDLQVRTALRLVDPIWMLLPSSTASWQAGKITKLHRIILLRFFLWPEVRRHFPIFSGSWSGLRWPKKKRGKFARTWKLLPTKNFSTQKKNKDFRGEENLQKKRLQLDMFEVSS